MNAVIIVFFAFVALSVAVTGTWQQVSTATQPPARAGAFSATKGNDWYVFGGVLEDYNEFATTFHNDLWKFNSQSSSWVQITPSDNVSPPARAFGAMQRIGNTLYMFGGGIYNFDADF